MLEDDPMKRLSALELKLKYFYKEELIVYKDWVSGNIC